MMATDDSMSKEEKVVFIFKCLNAPPIKEWLSISGALSCYVVVVSKEWYESVVVEMFGDGV